MALVRIAGLSELQHGQMRQAWVGGDEVLVCNDGGTIHAFQGLCPHNNGPLAHGNCVDGRIICPWHAWEFRCDTGAYDYNPAIRLKRYEVVVRDGDIFIDA